MVLVRSTPVMALPLAHPAAILLFRRWCPRVLSLPALVVGSLSPDFAYAFGPLQLDLFSHQLKGLVGFCLPAGMLALLLMRWLRRPLVGLLPSRWKQVLAPWCEQPMGSPFSLVVSVLIGASTHWFLDAVTHRDGWIVERVPVFRMGVIPVGERWARVHHVLWYGSTFVGVVWLCLVFQNWWQQATGSIALASARQRWIHALLLGGVTVLASLTYHLASSLAGDLAAGALLTIFLAGLLWRITSLR